VQRAHRDAGQRRDLSHVHGSSPSPVENESAA
jgi:hypothetical protein